MLFYHFHPMQKSTSLVQFTWDILISQVKRLVHRRQQPSACDNVWKCFFTCEFHKLNVIQMWKCKLHMWTFSAMCQRWNACFSFTVLCYTRFSERDQEGVKQKEREAEREEWAGTASTNNKSCWTQVVGGCDQYHRIPSTKANSLLTTPSHWINMRERNKMIN